MQGQPHGGFDSVGPLHPMAAVGRDEEVVSGSQHPGLEFILKAQAGAARKEHHPLVGVLVIPFPRRGGLACGNDALQTKILRLQEYLKDFLGYMGRNWGKEIGHKTPLLETVSGGYSVCHKFMPLADF